jgi:hypothetical protein
MNYRYVYIVLVRTGNAMLEPTDSTTRRNVLKLTGASLAAVAGSGVVSADHEHPDVRTGSGLPRPGGYADLYGDLLEFGEGASSVDVWFQWGDSPEGLVNETPKQTMTSTGQFSETIYGRGVPQVRLPGRRPGRRRWRHGLRRRSDVHLQYFEVTDQSDATFRRRLLRPWLPTGRSFR